MHAAVIYNQQWATRKSIDIIFRGIDKNIILLVFYKKRTNSSLFPDNFDLYHKDIRERQLLTMKKYENRAFAVKLTRSDSLKNMVRILVQCLLCEKYYHLLKCQEEEHNKTLL